MHFWAASAVLKKVAVLFCAAAVLSTRLGRASALPSTAVRCLVSLACAHFHSKRRPDITGAPPCSSGWQFQSSRSVTTEAVACTGEDR